MSSSIGSEVIEIVAFGAIAFILLRFASRRCFFNALEEAVWETPIQWFHVLGVFSIYFGISYFVTPLLIAMFAPLLQNATAQETRIGLMTWLNFFNSVLILFVLLVVAYKNFKTIWRKNGQPPNYLSDLKEMLKTLILALSVIFFLSNVIDFIVYGIFRVENLPDQIAVQWLKTTFGFPGYFFLTALTIVGIAPILEETLFRGFLQSFLRKHLGTKIAIVLTSFCFACFHYSLGQGWNNIPIIASLFPLALFLGYLYEKQGSLFASISMHATFNAISLINIYYFGQFL